MFPDVFVAVGVRGVNKQVTLTMFNPLKLISTIDKNFDLYDQNKVLVLTFFGNTE